MGRVAGLQGAGLVPLSRVGAILGSPPLDFDYDTFTAGMAKRATGVFAAAPIVQGNWDTSGVSDILTTAASAQIHGDFGDILDQNQGTVVCWVTPEWDGNDGLAHEFLTEGSVGTLRFRKFTDNRLYFNFGNGSHSVDASGWTAGTTYCIVGRWDLDHALDGTNHICLSVNDSHSFGRSSAITPLGFTMFAIGQSGVGYRVGNTIIEGLTVYRRPLFDGTYGVAATFDASGPVDEIAAIYAAGAGADPCLTTGSWDVVFCLPTDSTEGALVTGTGEAWSHPHSSNVLNHWTLEDAFYGGGQWAVAFDGTSTNINCGSAAVLDDLGAGGNQFTVDGWVRYDNASASNTYTVIAKGYTAQGWIVCVTNTGVLRFIAQCATTPATSEHTLDMQDGKWHHFAAHYNDATKTARLAVDGVWTSSGTGVGNYVSDAARNLYMGRASSSANWWWDGAIGWVRLSNNDRHTAGTDFIPPREFPAADGNTVEAWSLADGTGATAAAQVTSPGNDGTITAGTWEQQWDDVGTPVYPTSLEFDGSATSVNCGSGATLDDIPSGVCTFEAWIRADGYGENNQGYIVGKQDVSRTRGWRFALHSSYGLQCLIKHATTEAISRSGTEEFVADGKWHHVVAYFDDGGDDKIYLAVDGRWVSSYHTQTAAAGAYSSDAADDLDIGNNAGNTYTFDGAMSWVRLSDNDRHGAGSTFVPPDRVNPPAPDGNTVEQWNLQDGAGLTAVAQVTSPGNDGTITMGTGRWWNTPDAENEGPESRVYQWGYDIGSDAANDGVHQHLAGLSAGENYVARIPVRYEADKRCQPSIVAYDETNGAAISTFLGPWMTGTHDGGAAAASLSDSTAPYWPYSLVGGTVYNITDGSSATITAAGNSIVGGLAGGGSNDWNNGETYFIVPPDEWVWCEPFCFELPTIARNGAAVDCVEISLRLLNSAGEGVIYWQQVEVLENLVDNPSLETGAGNPWIPDGWTNAGIAAGESVQELAIVHSGSSAIEFTGAITAADYVYQDGIFQTDSFVMNGHWGYGDGTDTFEERRHVAGQNGQYMVSGPAYFGGGSSAVWRHAAMIWRMSGAGGTRITSNTPTTSVYGDDIYAFPLTDVSLTVTPASEANSAETSGLRVDGQDLCSWTPPAGRLLAAQGWLRWNWTPRHDAADLAGFAGGTNLPWLVYIFGDANNLIIVEVTAANTIQLDVTAAAANAVDNWNCAGAIVAGTTYKFEVRWDGNWFRLYVDDALVADVNVGPMAIDPTIVYWGCSAAPIHGADATYAAP